MPVPLVRPSLEKLRSKEKPEGEDAEAVLVAVEIVGENGTLAQPESACNGSLAGTLTYAPGASQESTSRLEESEEVQEVGNVTNAGGSCSSKCVHPS